MGRNSAVVFEWSWTEVSVLGSHVFGQASMEGCACLVKTHLPPLTPQSKVAANLCHIFFGNLPLSHC